MDPGYNKENRQLIESNAKALGIPITIFESNIFDSVDNIEKSPCYICARMRRGFMYSKAKELGCNKIALGHHYDDVIETILMGMLQGGQIQTMMPKLHSTNFEGMELIRPMYFIRESDICAGEITTSFISFSAHAILQRPVRPVTRTERHRQRDWRLRSLSKGSKKTILLLSQIFLEVLRMCSLIRSSSIKKMA